MKDEKSYNKPVITTPPSVATPKVNPPKSSRTFWSFSFKYFKQIKHFGFSHTDTGWFISLLERLQDLSSISKEDFEVNYNLKNKYRYHTINWNGEAVPIRKSDLNWIDSDFLNNDEEFPFYQFHVSKALGRIVGFWNNTNTVFNIVLLDPMHNIQPSDYNDYKVKDCHPIPCEHTILLNYIDELKRKTCSNDGCGFKEKLSEVPSHIYPERIVISHIEESTYNDLQNALKTHSISELIVLGVLSLN